MTASATARSRESLRDLLLAFPALVDSPALHRLFLHVEKHGAAPLPCEQLTEKGIALAVVNTSKKGEPPRANELIRRFRLLLDAFRRTKECLAVGIYYELALESSCYVLREREHPPTVRFWQGHFSAAPGDHAIHLVYNEPLFIRVLGTDLILRFQRHNRDFAAAMKALRRALPGIRGRELLPTNLYLFRGEMRACQEIRRWFEANAADTPVKVESSYKDHPRIEKGHFVLLGSPELNPVIESIEAIETGLPYRFEQNQVVIHKPPAAELQALRAAKVLRQDRGRQYWVQDQLAADPYQVFAVVTRIPNPQLGAITMICADYNLALGQIANVLTDDAVFTAAKGMSQLPPALPDRIQMLFRLSTSPTLRDQLTDVELLCFRDF